MQELSPVAFVIALVILGFVCWLSLLPLWMYNRVKGIERALWAIVSQLHAARLEKDDPVQQLQSRSGNKVPAPTGMISTSMFGR